MSHAKKPGPDPPDIQGEIRRNRPFSVSEAIGRQGAGNLKGGSPVAPAQQVLLAITQHLDLHLVDPEGALRDTLATHLADDTPLLSDHFEDPLGALRVYLDRVLSSDPLLEALVRQTDARWGRTYGERPYFQREGRPPHPDDPYTTQSVAARLTQLRDQLPA